MVSFQDGDLDLKHFDPEFVREPVPGKTSLLNLLLAAIRLHYILAFPVRGSWHWQLQ